MKNKGQPLFYAPECHREDKLLCLGHPKLIPALRDTFPSPGRNPGRNVRVLRENPNYVLETSLLEQQDFPWPRQVVKHFGWWGVRHFLTSPLKKSKAVRSFQAACHLLEHGLQTPVPLGVVELRKQGFVLDSYYISQAVENAINFSKYIKKMPDGESAAKEVVELLADYVLRMHDSGMWHRDLNTTNILLKGAPGEWNLYLIDLNRVKRLGYMPFFLRALELSRLNKMKKWQDHFFRFYCAGRFDWKLMRDTSVRVAAIRKMWRRIILRSGSSPVVKG